MEIFLQKRLSWFRQQSESLRLLFFIFATLALFALSMGMPFLGFIYSGLSLVLFFAIPASITGEKKIEHPRTLPEPIRQYNELESIQPELDWLNEGNHFTQLREYLSLLQQGQAPGDPATIELQNLAKANIDQLEAELYLTQAYSRLISLDALELGLINSASTKSEHALLNFGKRLNNNGHWRYACAVLIKWAESYGLNLQVKIKTIEAAWNCKISFEKEQLNSLSIQSPILSIFLQQLAQQYDGTFMWDKAGQSISILLPKQKIPSSTT